LSERWTKAGHRVEKFCLTDAFPKPTRSRALSAWRQTVFPYQAARYIRRNASRFDVIDALIGTVPFSKERLRFDGLVVARSVGFPRVYERFNRFSRERWPDQPKGKVIGRLFYAFISWLWRRSNEHALRLSDLINLLNEDEIQSLQDAPAISTPFIVQPNGLSERERAALANAMQPPEIRLHRKEICFLGMWGLRKGARDWPEIIRAILNEEPSARFTFLGTMTDEQTVLRDLQLSSSESIRCLTSYDPKELPQLIGGSAVGLFPSYIEGFGLSVLEQLASGIPTIAYDVPGPRHIFSGTGPEFLVPAGSVRAMSDRALEILRMNESDYSLLSAKCRHIAARFDWEQIATDTIREYTAALPRRNSGNQQRRAQTVSV
jgi:glycosyltransferase involved in cell wall biosynthesis